MKARGTGAVINIGSGMSIKANPTSAATLRSMLATCRELGSQTNGAIGLNTASAHR